MNRNARRPRLERAVHPSDISRLAGRGHRPIRTTCWIPTEGIDVSPRFHRIFVVQQIDDKAWTVSLDDNGHAGRIFIRDEGFHYARCLCQGVRINRPISGDECGNGLPSLGSRTYRDRGDVASYLHSAASRAASCAAASFKVVMICSGRSLLRSSAVSTLDAAAEMMDLRKRLPSRPSDART